MSETQHGKGCFFVGEFAFQARAGGYDVWSMYSPRAVASVEEPIPGLYDVHVATSGFSFQASTLEDLAEKLVAYGDLEDATGAEKA